MALIWRWLLLAALAATTQALPVPEEEETIDTSSKLLGSSVVTSVSVVMRGEEGGNEKSDTVRKVTDDLPASTVDMLKPDGFQFYTVDEKGQLITRQMTESEIHSIIAAGGGPFPSETQDAQKVGGGATGEMKVADVVQNVQNVLKGELNKPAAAMGTVPTIPGHANDEWSSILPSILGGDAESAPVTLTGADEPDRETKHNATVSEVQATTSANEVKPDIPSIPEIKPQAIAPEAEKPTSGNKPAATSAKKPEVASERPMIPVPVINADSVQLTTKIPSLSEAKPVYEMLDTISADEVKDQTPVAVPDKETSPTTEKTKTDEAAEPSVAPTTQTILETEVTSGSTPLVQEVAEEVEQKLETSSIGPQAPAESEKPAEEAPKTEATTLAATVEEEIVEIEKVLPQAVSSIVNELVSETTGETAEADASEEKKPDAQTTEQAVADEEDKTKLGGVSGVPDNSVDQKTEAPTVFEKLPEMSATKIVEPEATESVPTATIIVPSPTIIVPEAAISEDEIEEPSEKDSQTEATLTLTTKKNDLAIESTTKTETLLAELADSVSSMISQVSEMLPSMVPIPQKSESGDQLVKRVENGVTVKNNIPEATEKAEVLSPPKEETKKPEVIMVEIKAPETTKVSEQPAAAELPTPSSTLKTEAEKVPVKSEEAAAQKPEIVEEKIDIVPKDETKTEIIETGGEVPIVRIDITETKPTETDEKIENPSESSVVRIQLTNPVSKINEMIDSAPDVVVSPLEIEQMSVLEKNVLDGSASDPQTAGSSLIAGMQPETTTEIKKQEDLPKPQTPVQVASSVESENTDAGLETTSSTGLKSTVEISSDKKSELVNENAKIPEVKVPQATAEAKPEVIKDENTEPSTSDMEISKTKEEEPEKPVDGQNLKDQKPVEATSEKVEPPTKTEALNKTTESSEKIFEPTTVVTVEKIEEMSVPESVKETAEEAPATTPEVVVATNVEVQPTKASLQQNTEPVKDEEVKPLKPEEKPAEKTPANNTESETPTTVKSEAKPEAETPSKDAESKPVTPLKSADKPEKEKPSKNAESKPSMPEKSEEKPVEETPLKKIENETPTTLKSEVKPEVETPLKDVEIKPLKSEKKPEEGMPSKIDGSKPLKPEEKPVKEIPSKDADIKTITPLKSEEKPVVVAPSKNIDSKPVKPLESEEKPVEGTSSKDESEPTTALKSEEKPEAEVPSKNVESKPASDNIETAINDAPENLVPVKLALPAPTQPDTQQADHIPDVSTPAPKVPEKIETQTVAALADVKTESQTVKESSGSEVKPEVVPTEETKSPPSGDKPEKETAAAAEKVDQVPVPLVRVDVSPEKNRPEASTSMESNVDKIANPEIPAMTEAKLPEVDESLKKTEIPVVASSSIQPATEIKVPEVDESTKKTEKPKDDSVAESSSIQPVTEVKVPEVDESTKKTEKLKDDSVVESSNVQTVEPAILESSSKAPVDVSDSIPKPIKVEMPAEVMKPEIVVEKTEESIKEPANKIPEVTVSTETISAASPVVTKVESVEAAKPVGKIEATPPLKTQEVRIQVNDTAVLVMKQKTSEKVDNEKKKVESIAVSDSKITGTEASSQTPEPAKVPTAATISQEQNDKPMVQEDVDKMKIEATKSEQKTPASDPFVKLGEKKPEGVVKTQSLSDKKPEDKWTLIPQSEPYPIIKQQQAKPSATKTTLDNKNEADSQQPSVPLEAHQSAVNLEESTRDLDKDIGEFSKLCNELAFSFWVAANKGLSTARSLALSPFGMTSMLAMVFLGARGPTSGQMNDVLKLDDVVTFNPHLVFQNITDSVNLARGQGIANAAFVRELFADKSKAGRILSFYKERAQQFYDGHIEEVNFASISDLVRRRTNLLVRRQTGGRIRDFVKGNVMSLRSPLAALSANVFQTDCTGASSEGRDGEMYFAVLPAVRQRKLVPVPATVWRSGVLAGYEPGLDATVMSLGGIGSLVSTIFVLPGQQGLAAPGDSLDHLERRLLKGAVADGVWDRLLKVLIPRMGLEVQVPKFSHRSVVNATAALKRMGLDDLFSRHADLKGVNGIGNDLHLADMLQINLFSTCGDEVITGGRHHVEIYPASPLRGARQDTQNTEDPEEHEEMSTDEDNSRSRRSLDDKSNADEQLIEGDAGEDRSFRSSMTPISKGKQTDRPVLKLDRPFLYFVRHNPTGMILHMGRFNPRLMP